MTTEEGQAGPPALGAGAEGRDVRPLGVEIEIELRKLRLVKGKLTARFLANSPTLIHSLANGEPLAAFRVLATYRLAEANRENPNRDTLAALYSIGLGSGANTVMDRLSDFALFWAERVGLDDVPDQRTVRRWSDKGLKGMAASFATEFSWLKPLATIILRQGGEDVALGVIFRQPRGLIMKKPTILIGDIEVHPKLRLERRDLWSDLVGQFGPLRPPLRVEVAWPGTRFPVWELDASDVPNELSVSLLCHGETASVVLKRKEAPTFQALINDVARFG